MGAGGNTDCVLALPHLACSEWGKVFLKRGVISAVVKYLLSLVLFLLFLHVPGFPLDRWVGNCISVYTEEKETLLI